MEAASWAFGRGGVNRDNDFYDAIEEELVTAPRTLTSDLYHYTSSEAAILGILANRTLRMSSFTGTNDLWESEPQYLAMTGGNASEMSDREFFEVVEDVDRFIRKHSKVACFAQDWQLPDYVMNRDALRGWSHLSLWAHYGARHTGVCFRFDRDRLLEAFGAAQGDAVHQFSGPVRYHHSAMGVGPYPIDLEQAAEFGLDAVALQYSKVHSDQVYFRKHADWASESEFRLVRTDLSSEPHHVDIGQALTGIVLGHSFPKDRLPALRAIMTNFENVELLQARFFNRTFGVWPWEAQTEPHSIPHSDLTVALAIEPRHAGDLAERLSELEAT